MKHLLLSIFFSLSIISAFSQQTGKLVDKRDGKVYRIVMIGNQWWMAQNMACNTGNCFPYNQDESTLKTYGYYYTWSSAQDACPAGWHLPSMEDWKILQNYLGGDNGSGGKLKSLDGWDSPNTGATDEYGFDGRPGGDGNYQTLKFFSMGRYANFWSAKPCGNNLIQYYYLSYEHDRLLDGAIDKNTGLINVRCVKD